MNRDSSVIDAYNLVRGVSLPYFGARYKDYIIYRAHLTNIIEEGKESISFKDGHLVLDQFKIN